MHMHVTMFGDGYGLREYGYGLRVYGYAHATASLPRRFSYAAGARSLASCACARCGKGNEFLPGSLAVHAPVRSKGKEEREGSSAAAVITFLPGRGQWQLSSHERSWASTLHTVRA